MLNRQLHERASELFLELRPLPEAERRARLAEAAGGSGALVEEVLSLWKHDSEGPTSPESPAAAWTDADPTRIGPYRIVQRLGRGGSGLVLLAEQTEPVKRRVAIKLVPHAAISPELAARFEFERRALERTEHPNIARILDAGRTPDGLPYLVMEYVNGEPITRYCDSHALPLADRISLVMAVADAVQHAHQRGVIHRDLKPGNIFVSDASGRPMPRVLDFGIAKPVFSEVGDATLTLATPLGTPAYMAPEQTGGRAVDTRADIYALGAVLYELVCGRPPLEPAAHPGDWMRRIREQDPPPASRVRAQRGGGKEPAPRSMLLDLDRVLAKALEKDPARRYQTAAAFADDLGRVLRREPVAARSPTAGYRAARFVQRNRGLTAALAVVVLAVLVGVAGLTAGLVEARRELANAVSQSEVLQEINRFLTDDLLGAPTPEREGSKITALELLRRASRTVDERFGSRPLVAAAIHYALGTALTQLGAFDEADHHLTSALAIRRSVAGLDAPETVRTEVAAASLLGQRQQYADARPALESAVARARRVLGPDDPVLYAALNDLGVVDEELGDAPTAVRVLSEALTGRQRLLGAHDQQVLITMSNLAQAYDRAGDSARSLQALITTLRTADAMPEPPTMLVLGLCNNIGATYQDLNRDADAEPYLKRASDLAAQWLGADNPDALTIRGNLAGLETKLGDPQRGAALYQEIAAAQARVLGPEAESTLSARYGYCDALWHAKRFDDAAAAYEPLLADVERALGTRHWLAAQTRASLARTLGDGGHPDRALPLAEQALAQFTAVLGADNARTRTTADLVAALRRAVHDRISAPPGSKTPADGEKTQGGR